MTRFASSLGLILAASLATGCVAGADGGAPSDPEPVGPRREVHEPPLAPRVAGTLRERLARPRTLGLDPESASGAISVRYRHDGRVTEIPLAIRTGHLTVVSADDGAMEIRGLAITLEDIAAAPLSPGGGSLELTDLRTTMQAPLRCRPVFTGDDGEALCEASGEAKLDWSLRLQDGRSWPLESQTLAGVRVSAHVFLRPEGRVGLDLELTTPADTSWSIADFADLSGFGLAAEAVEVPVLH